MASFESVIPANDLITPLCVYNEFETHINLYRGRIKKFINKTLQKLPPMSLLHCYTNIEIDSLIEYITSPQIVDMHDEYKYSELVELFQYFKNEKNIPEHNLINYILSPITIELIKLNYNVTLQYMPLSIEKKYTHPIIITLKWNH